MKDLIRVTTEKAREVLANAEEKRLERANALREEIELLGPTSQEIHWKVREYNVKFDIERGEFSCDCPDYNYRKIPCKHILAVCSVLAGDNASPISLLASRCQEFGYFPRKIDGSYDIDILHNLLETRYPILLIGPRGAGKDLLIEVYGKIIGKQVTIVPLRGEVDEGTLYGRYETTEDGKLRFEYGVIPRALYSGSILVLDEVNACPPDKLFSLHHLLARFSSGDSELLIPEFNKKFKVHPEARIVATMNENYGGVNELNQALYDRFLKFFLNYDEIIDRKIIEKFGFSSVDKVIEVIRNIRDLRLRGEVLTDWSHRLTERLCLLVKSELPTEFIINSLSLEFYPEERFTLKNILRVAIHELQESRKNKIKEENNERN